MLVTVYNSRTNGHHKEEDMKTTKTVPDKQRVALSRANRIVRYDGIRVCTPLLVG